MPVKENARAVITAFGNVPDFAKGYVRDLRIRWAMEEIGRDYRLQFLDAMVPKPPGYRDWQPFGQVPAFDDGAVRLFESGAILLYLGEQDERLIPRDPTGRWAVTTWLIAALNSVEPAIMQIGNLDIFQADKPWAAQARPSAVEAATSRLKSTERALGDKEWLAGTFSVADIMMVTVLRELEHTDILDQFPGLAALKRRGEDRPAFQRALADHFAGFSENA